MHRLMDQQSVIADIEERAFFAGVSISALCKSAGVHPTTFSRWKRSEMNPEPMGATLLSIGKLYDALAKFEAANGRKRRKVSA